MIPLTYDAEQPLLCCQFSVRTITELAIVPVGLIAAGCLRWLRTRIVLPRLDNPRHVLAAAPRDASLGNGRQQVREIGVEVPESL